MTNRVATGRIAIVDSCKNKQLYKVKLGGLRKQFSDPELLPHLFLNRVGDMIRYSKAVIQNHTQGFYLTLTSIALTACAKSTLTAQHLGQTAVSAGSCYSHDYYHTPLN
ncbi:hypothetical protein J6590_011537 [Homalodisca vitripennis]|nr:hypothetical protein J6590_011537 [Homalodisca vitripennis]